MTVARQATIYLVEGDYGQALRMTFTGFDLTLYTSVDLIVSRQDGTRFRRPVAIDPEDSQIGLVIWEPGDLIAGRHQGEFEFIGPGDQRLTLPQRYTIILEVRKDLL